MLFVLVILAVAISGVFLFRRTRDQVRRVRAIPSCGPDPDAGGSDGTLDAESRAESSDPGMNLVGVVPESEIQDDRVERAVPNSVPALPQVPHREGQRERTREEFLNGIPTNVVSQS